MALRTQVAVRMTPEELCSRYAARVAKFASIAAGADADADDIAQEALLKAIRHLNGYDARRGSYDAWLWRIVVNTARDSMRRARVREILRLRLSQEHNVIDVEAAAIERATASELYESLERLGPRDRELLALRFGSEMSTAEVGAVLGLSAETARRAIGRALERARAQLRGGTR